ncbi:MAG: ADP-glyceromanno-heptose 6-epimerase [Bacteroidota bacterium]|nr:ADP-glyceromanno-heptose 6-epimerase [Bacteroidota bacterium]
MINKQSAIVITGAAGFIGSCMVGYLNRHGYENLILVDEFNDEKKELNLHQKKYLVRVERDNFFEWLNIENPDVKFIFHLGARTDTAEFDYAIHKHLNVDYAQNIWNYCTKNNLPLVYASSAATYGGGELGYNDDHNVIGNLHPLNPYGISKNEFDKWVLLQAQDAKSCPPFWAGLKFFNVYGPNEYHKARMASMIFHSFHQINKNGVVKLFKSNSKDFNDGEQLRDFIYVKDLIKICYWFMENTQKPTGNRQQIKSGIYNVGTGKARSFNDLANAVFAAMHLIPVIEYIDMPSDIKDKYQNFTEANMLKLSAAGYSHSFYSLENGVGDYVANYLNTNRYY